MCRYITEISTCITDPRSFGGGRKIVEQYQEYINDRFWQILLKNTLNLLQRFKAIHPNMPTKSGLMVGLGETDVEILQVLCYLRAHDFSMLTIGQYLQSTGSHMPARRYVHPDTFKMYEEEAHKMGFVSAASDPWCAAPTIRINRRMQQGYFDGCT